MSEERVSERQMEVLKGRVMFVVGVIRDLPLGLLREEVTEMTVSGLFFQ
jgi:hypothetical protein